MSEHAKKAAHTRLVRYAPDAVYFALFVAYVVACLKVPSALSMALGFVFGWLMSACLNWKADVRDYFDRAALASAEPAPNPADTDRAVNARRERGEGTR